MGRARPGIELIEPSKSLLSPLRYYTSTFPPTHTSSKELSGPQAGPTDPTKGDGVDKMAPVWVLGEAALRCSQETCACPHSACARAVGVGGTPMSLGSFGNGWPQEADFTGAFQRILRARMIVQQGGHLPCKWPVPGIPQGPLSITRSNS